MNNSFENKETNAFALWDETSARIYINADRLKDFDSWISGIAHEAAHIMNNSNEHDHEFDKTKIKIEEILKKEMLDAN